VGLQPDGDELDEMAEFHSRTLPSPSDTVLRGSGTPRVATSVEFCVTVVRLL